MCGRRTRSARVAAEASRQQHVEDGPRGEEARLHRDDEGVEREARERDGDDDLHGVRDVGRDADAHGREREQREDVDAHDEQHRRDAAQDGHARRTVHEVDDRALADVVVDGGQQVRRAAHDGHLRERQRREEPAERLPDRERVGEVDRGDAGDARGDRPRCSRARRRDDGREGDLPEEKEEERRRDEPGRRAPEALSHQVRFQLTAWGRSRA